MNIDWKHGRWYLDGIGILNSDTLELLVAPDQWQRVRFGTLSDGMTPNATIKVGNYEFDYIIDPHHDTLRWPQKDTQ